MSKLFESLNNTTIDFNDYETTELTDLEKSQIRKRISMKLKNKKPTRPKQIIAAAAVLALFSFGFAGIFYNPSVMANIPLIGAALEEYIDSNRPTLQDYKVVIGQTVGDNGIEIKLNEVLLDNGRIIISSTFGSSTVDLDKISMTPTVYINSKKIHTGSHGSIERVDDSTCISCVSVDLENINIKEMLNIKISFNDDMYYTDTGKKVKGNWDDFQFAATGQRLMSETKTIAINKKLEFDDGQEITVKDMNISPFSTLLNYSSVNGKDDISFQIEDQDGNRQLPNSSLVLSENSYNRFDEKSLENATELTIIPVRFILETGAYEPFPDKAFEVKCQAFL